MLKKTFEEAAFTGFYPRLFDKKIPPSVFYPSYLQTYVQRDVMQITRLADADLFIRFIKLLAGRVGQLVNYTSLASDIGVAVNTIRSWVGILEMSYIIFTLKPHSLNFNRRLVQQPKVYFYDTGLLCYLLELQKASQLNTHFARGSIFENLIILDLIKNKFNQGKPNNLFFWRDHKGKEVDCIIDTPAGPVPVEIKSSQTRSIYFFDGISQYKNLSKGKSKPGYVVYSGADELELNEGKILPWNNMKPLYLES